MTRSKNVVKPRSPAGTRGICVEDTEGTTRRPSWRASPQPYIRFTTLADKKRKKPDNLINNMKTPWTATCKLGGLLLLPLFPYALEDILNEKLKFVCLRKN